MEDNIFNDFLEKLNMTDGRINDFSPLALAFVGDSVFEVFVRAFVLSQGNVSPHKLHSKCVRYVKAQAQAGLFHRIKDSLTEEELDVVRRGRNAKSGTIPKNADVNEYKYATGFEALVGYLYLKRQNKRLLEIMQMALEQQA